MTGIVLNVIKYNERHNIAHVFTRSHGRMAFLVRTGSTPAARRRQAMMRQLAMLDFEHREPRHGAEIGLMHDAQPALVTPATLSDPAKSAIAIFIAEVLSHTLQPHEPDEALFDFLDTSIRALEAAKHGVANFHLSFLFRYGRFLGVQPDVSGYSSGAWFDMEEGVFTQRATSRHSLPPEHARVIYLLSRMNYDNLHIFRFERKQRNMVLDTILLYLQLHNSTLGTLKSPAVLRQLFV